MGINFPSSPTEGQVFTPIPGTPFFYSGDRWRRPRIRTALPRNYLLNPTMQVMQQYAPTTNIATATSGIGYPVDQWMMSWSLGSVYSARSNQGYSGMGSYTVLTFAPGALAATPAGGYMQIQQAIEGVNSVDFQWGTANGQQAIFAFSFYTNVAGNYSIQVKNIGAIYTYTALFNVPTASVWGRYALVIPPPPVGSTWNNDYTLGINVGLGLDAGTTYGGGLNGGWQNSNKVTATGSLQAGALGATMMFSDAGFYLDPFQTGIAPPFEYPDYAEELRRCRRYWNRIYCARGGFYNTTSMGDVMGPLGCYMVPNASPANSELTIVGSPKAFDGSATTTINSVIGHYSSYAIFAADLGVNSAMTSGRPAIQYFSTDADYLAISRRLM